MAFPAANFAQACDVLAIMGRVEDRATFDTPTRMRLIESDLDKLDTGMTALHEKIDIAGEDFRRTMSKILWTMMGAVFTFSTATVLLALNILVVQK